MQWTDSNSSLQQFLISFTNDILDDIKFRKTLRQKLIRNKHSTQFSHIGEEIRNLDRSNRLHKRLSNIELKQHVQGNEKNLSSPGQSNQTNTNSTPNHFPTWKG